MRPHVPINLKPPTISGCHLLRDRLAALKSEYELVAKEPSNLRYATSGRLISRFGLLPNGFGGDSSPKPLRGADGARVL